MCGEVGRWGGGKRPPHVNGEVWGLCVLFLLLMVAAEVTWTIARAIQCAWQQDRFPSFARFAQSASAL